MSEETKKAAASSAVAGTSSSWSRQAPANISSPMSAKPASCHGSDNTPSERWTAHKASIGLVPLSPVPCWAERRPAAILFYRHGMRLSYNSGTHHTREPSMQRRDVLLRVGLPGLALLLTGKSSLGQEKPVGEVAQL